MALHEHLLEQARHLATRDKRRPRQANLRRAISSSYYALFHFLADRASRFLVGSSGERDQIRKVLSRAFGHTEMYSACKSFGGGNLPDGLAQRLAGVTIPGALQDLARRFGSAQELRHQADYDLAVSFQRGDALSLIVDIELQMSNWPTIESDPATRLFMLALLVWDRLKRRTS